MGRSGPCASGGERLCEGEARLSEVKGGVLLSRGGSFSEIGEGAHLVPGDRIIAKDASANVVVGENVVSRVRPASW